MNQRSLFLVTALSAHLALPAMAQTFSPGIPSPNPGKRRWLQLRYWLAAALCRSETLDRPEFFVNQNRTYFRYRDGWEQEILQTKDNYHMRWVSAGIGKLAPASCELAYEPVQNGQAPPVQSRAALVASGEPTMFPSVGLCVSVKGGGKMEMPNRSSSRFGC